MSQASEVYARLLLPKRLGFPLWNPAPDDNLVVEYREKGVSIGDVGLLTSDGEFDFLFNICVPAGHAVNQYGVPADFEDVSGSIQISKNARHHAPGTNIASNSKDVKAIEASVTIQDNPSIPIGAGGGFNFAFSTSEGAILVMPEGGSQENIRDKGTFMDQALKHGLAWYEYANVTRRRLAENGSLYLVTGCDKTTSWGIACFSNSSGGNQMSLTFTAAQIASGNASRSYKWETSSPATVRYGPIPETPNIVDSQSHGIEHLGRSRRRRGRGGRRSEGPVETQSISQDSTIITPQNILQNQCVLVRGYRISIRPATLAKLKGPLKVSAIQDTDASDIFSRSGIRNIPFRNSGAGKRSWFGDIARRIGGGSGNQQVNKLSQDTTTDVILSSVPDASKICYPGAAINAYLLDAMPDAKVAVTHDSELWNLFNDDCDFPSVDELARRLVTTYRPVMQSGGVFIAPKDTDIVHSIEGDTKVYLRKENAESEQDGKEKAKKLKGKSVNETFIVVRPPPSKSNHPLNLCIQLVPPISRGDRDAGKRQSLDLSSELPPVSENDHDARSTKVAQSFADSGYGSVLSISTHAKPSSGRRMIIPLYNLHAHNIMTNIILDAGTDAKVAKFQRHGLEIIGLAVLVPVEVRGSIPSIDFNEKLPAANPEFRMSPASGSPLQGGLLADVEQPRGDLHAARAAALEQVNTSPASASGKLEGFFTKFRRTSTRVAGSSGAKSASSPPASPHHPSSSAPISSFVYGNTIDTPAGPVLGIQPKMSSVSQYRGRPTKYVWVVGQWLKGKEGVIGQTKGVLNLDGKSRAPMTQNKVQFEWSRGKTGQKRRQKVKESRMSSSSLPIAEHGSNSGSISSGIDLTETAKVKSAQSTSHPEPKDPDVSGDESDSEDSETPWTCTMSVQRVVPSTSMHEPTNTTHVPKDDGTIHLKIAILSPTPHHPKVVSMIKIPFPLPDIEVDKMTIHQRILGPTGIASLTRASSGHGEGLTLTADEIKDIVSCTALWLVIREGFGGVGRISRRGDGWRIRG